MAEWTEHGLTVQMLAKMSYTGIKVMSGYNGKLLCKRFDEKKHPHIADRVVTSVWAEIVASKSMCFDNIAMPILCVFVNGKKEYEEEHNG